MQEVVVLQPDTQNNSTQYYQYGAFSLHNNNYLHVSPTKPTFPVVHLCCEMLSPMSRKADLLKEFLCEYSIIQSSAGEIGNQQFAFPTILKSFSKSASVSQN